MNIIKEQAEDFMRMNSYSKYTMKYTEYMDMIRSYLYNYQKDSYKLDFLYVVESFFVRKQEEHAKKCRDPKTCQENKFYRNILFLLNNEIEEKRKYITDESFSQDDKINFNDKLEEILEKMQTLENGQEIIYEDLSKELNEMKEFYFLNKKNWSEMFVGKLSMMIGSGIISETVSKDIVEIIKEEGTNLIEQL